MKHAIYAQPAQIVSLFGDTTPIKNEEIPRSSPHTRVDTILSDDIYGIRDLVKKVEQKLQEQKRSLNTWIKNKKISTKYDHLFEKNPETNQFFSFEYVKFLDMLFDKLYQRKDLFNANNIITSLDNHGGYVTQAEKPFIIFDRPQGTIDKDGKDGSGKFNPDGMHACTMHFIAGNQQEDLGATCMVWKFKSGISFEDIRRAELFVFDTMQEVTTMTAESRFKVHFHSPNDYGQKGKDASILGEFLWRENLNCVDLFDKTTHRIGINSIGALKRGWKFFGNLDFLPNGIEIYKRTWNTKKKTLHAATTKMNMDVVSSISVILKGITPPKHGGIKIETENGGHVDQEILVNSLVSWCHNYESDSNKRKVNSTKDVSNLVKPLAPHFQIESGAIRIARIYNNYFTRNKNLHESKSLMITEESILKLVKIVEDAKEEIKKLSEADLKSEEVKGIKLVT